MRLLAAPLLLVAACGSSPKTRSPTPTTESPQAFLVESAAKDFRANPPGATDFRDVKFGHVLTQTGDKQFMLCGEFLPPNATEWQSFATIKTSNYEQWVGGHASCAKLAPEVADVSGALRERFAKP